VRQTTDKVARGKLYSLPGGVHKGHEFILDFSGRPAERAHAALSAPLMARASAEYYASTEAAPGWFAPPKASTGDDECDWKLAAWNRMARNAADPAGDSSIIKARRTGVGGGYWYGWMDFGDLAIGQGRGYGPCNLHYDWTWVMLVNYLRLGDRAFFDLAGEMARHRMDVDQGWSDRDLLIHRGLQRSQGARADIHCPRLAYAKPTPASNWVSGVALYYMLTGEPKALETCLRNVQGVRNAWEADKKKDPYYRMARNMEANAWSILVMCSLHDLTGEKEYLDEALGLFRANVVPVWRKLGPHLFRAGSQIRGQSYHKEGMKYCYSIQALCELHHRTGDKAVLKLLTEGAKKDFPDTFFDAPLHLSSLHAYVGYKTDSEEYLEKAVESFIEGFPESKSPPVVMPDSSEWSRRAAILLRTGHILQYVHWKRGAK